MTDQTKLLKQIEALTRRVETLEDTISDLEQSLRFTDECMVDMEEEMQERLNVLELALKLKQHIDVYKTQD